MQENRVKSPSYTHRPNIFREMLKLSFHNKIGSSISVASLVDDDQIVMFLKIARNVSSFAVRRHRRRRRSTQCIRIVFRYTNLFQCILSLHRLQQLVFHALKTERSPRLNSKMST